MTLRLYADRKGWPLDEVRVALAHRKIHATDQGDCGSRPARMDVLERDVRLEGALDEAQRRRLLEIAERCPVHQTLEASVRVVTRGG